MSLPALTFEDIRFSYPDGTEALRGVSFEVPEGQFCVVVGASGAGKSTLLHLVNGMTSATGGALRFRGEVVSPRNLRAVQLQVAMIHQQFHLVPRLSVLQNVLCGRLAAMPWMRAMLGLFSRADQVRACALLEGVGLSEEHLYRRARELSGGQQQRVAIARAFLPEPALVLADEPVASLDPKTAESILELLQAQSRQHGATVLCSLHQVELARRFADRIIGMRQGEVAFDAAPEQISDAQWAEMYDNQPQAEAS